MTNLQVIETRDLQRTDTTGLNQGQISVITQKTPQHLVFWRKGRSGQNFCYIPHNYVTELLNQAFNHAWSFETEVLQAFCNKDELTVKGRLIVHGKDGKQIVKEQFGQQDILKDKKGNPAMSYGDALKGASSDALRKCASLLGVGLDLYGTQLPENRPTKLINISPVPIIPKNQGTQAPVTVSRELEKSTFVSSEKQVNHIRQLIQSHHFTDAERLKAEKILSDKKTDSNKASRLIARLQQLIRERREIEKTVEKAEKKKAAVKAMNEKRYWYCKCGSTIEISMSKNSKLPQGQAWWLYLPETDNRKEEAVCPGCQLKNNPGLKPEYTARNSDQYKVDPPVTSEQAKVIKDNLSYYNLTGEKRESFLAHVEKVSGFLKHTAAFANELLPNFANYFEGWGGHSVNRV